MPNKWVVLDSRDTAGHRAGAMSKTDGRRSNLYGISPGCVADSDEANLGLSMTRRSCSAAFSTSIAISDGSGFFPPALLAAMALPPALRSPLELYIDMSCVATSEVPHTE